MTKARLLVLPEGTVAAGVVTLPDDVARHVRDVLRLRAGATVVVTDGAGVVAEGTIETVDRRQVEARLALSRPHSAPPGPFVRLYQGVGKGDKLETVVRQAVELGLRELEPLWTARTVAHQKVRIDRLRTIAEDAMRVSGRAWRPRVGAGVRWDEALGRPRAPHSYALVIGAARSLVEALQEASVMAGQTVELLVGPEGGLTDDESSGVEQAGFQTVHLGPHTLRTETAGPAAVAVTMALAGGWSTTSGSLR